MGFLNQKLYLQQLWYHQPLTDFWHIGHGLSQRLQKYDIYNMYGIAHCQQDILYKEFGVNAEYLIDHSWGREPTTIEDIKNYRPKNNSLGQSQILFEDYDYDNALLVLKEMVELKVLDLVEQHLVSNHISLHVSYSKHIVKSSRRGNENINIYKFIQHSFKRIYSTLQKNNTSSLSNSTN